MIVRVSRKRWGRGEKGGGQLLDSHGKMCCLGFACRQVGLKVADIKKAGLPLGAYNRIVALDHLVPETFLNSPLLHINSEGMRTNSGLSMAAAIINDSLALTDKVRERKLRTLFKKHGHKIVFVP